MPDKLCVGVLGDRNSGKSTGWDRMFGKKTRTGKELRKLWLNDREYVEVFLVSASPQEKNEYVEDLLRGTHPRIVLCSMQYRSDVMETVDFFVKHHYRLFVQWLNPGYSDDGLYFDELGLASQLLGVGAALCIRDGKADPEGRVREVLDYISGWARGRKLVRVVDG